MPHLRIHTVEGPEPCTEVWLDSFCSKFTGRYITHAKAADIVYIQLHRTDWDYIAAIGLKSCTQSVAKIFLAFTELMERTSLIYNMVLQHSAPCIVVNGTPHLIASIAAIDGLPFGDGFYVDAFDLSTPIVIEAPPPSDSTTSDNSESHRLLPINSPENKPGTAFFTNYGGKYE